MLKNLIIFTALAVPLAFLPQAHLTFELPKASLFHALTILLTLAATLPALKDKKFSLPKFSKIFLVFLGAFIVSLIIATITGIASHLSFFGSYERQQGLVQFFAYILFFVIFVSAFISPTTKNARPKTDHPLPLNSQASYKLVTKYTAKSSLLTFIENISLIAFLIAALAVLQKFLPGLTSFWNTDILVGRNSIGTLGNPNFLASYLAISLPFFILTYKNSQTKFLKIFWIFATITALMAIVFSASRSAISGVLAGAIFYAAIKNRKLLIVPAIIALIVIFLNIFAQAPLVKNTYFLSRLTFTEEITGSIKSRFTIWPATIKMIASRPIFGYGPETFETAFAKYSPKELLLTERFVDTADRAHNEILDTAASIGVVGLLSYLALLAYLIYAGIKSKSDIALAASTGIISLFVCNMFGFSTTSIYLVWWLCAGIIAVEFFKSKTYKIPKLATPTKIFLVFASVLIAAKLIFIFAINPILADYHYDQGMISSTNFESEKAVEEFKKAIAINPYQTYYALRSAEYAIVMTSTKMSEKPLSKSAEFFLSQAKKYLPENHLDIVYLDAKLAALNKNYTEALSKFTQAYTLAPTRPPVLLYYARTLAEAKKYKESLAIYEEYLNLVPIWKTAAETKIATEEEKQQFRLFFKHAPQFITAIGETANIAGILNDTVKYTYYKNAENVVKNTLTNIINE